ncbi:MAG: aldehyde dehydrogenase family protein [Candidatus Thermoplasmatota archaeon]|nr:aldehyde dehydrogenase family protein [Candidatus Thermoplasmatota archaeon]
MPFDNENTFIKASEKGEENRFHQEYEKALEEVKSYFGREYPNIVGKEVVEKEKQADISPIDGKEIAKFQVASEETINSAINMLHSGYRSWYALGYLARARTIMNAADIMSRDKYRFAALLAYEHGKTRMEAMGDVDEAIDFLRYYSMNLIENQGFEHFTGKAYKNEESRSIMKPYGVFAVIAPFNFFSITVGMVAGPLVVGNSVLLKPSSDIPLSSYLYVKLLLGSGVPKDVIAFVSGSGSRIGKLTYDNPRISGIVFTGSRNVGMSIYHNATKNTPKVVVTEMGGKDTIIVSSKADLPKAVEGVAKAAFGYAGQKCSACSVVIVHDQIYNKFRDMLVEYVSRIRPDDPRKKETFLTPIVNEEAFRKYRDLLAILPAEGKILSAGKAQEREGYYVEPVIISDVKWDSFVIQEEHFLPILAVARYSELREAVERINTLDYGLTGGIFTEDEAEIEYYFNNIEAGVIYANRRRGGTTGAMVGSQPFVGWKMSGSTGKGTGSFYYLQQFLREQSVTVAH